MSIPPMRDDTGVIRPRAAGGAALMQRLAELENAELTYQQARKEWKSKIQDWEAEMGAGTLDVTTDPPKPPQAPPTAESIRRDRENRRRDALWAVLSLFLWLSFLVGVGMVTSRSNGGQMASGAVIEH